MTKNEPKKEYYRAEDLAKKLDVSIITIYRYIRDKKIKAYKFGKEFRVEKNDFEKFLNKSIFK